MRLSLPALALGLTLLLTPLAAAGSDADPETGDDANDDVEVNGATCGLPASPPPNPHGCVWSPDFVWANVDIDWAWINDTADGVLITLEMKAGTAYAPDAGLAGSLAEASPFVYTYTFEFTANGTAYTTTAVMGADGVFALDGVATAFSVHDGNDLTITIPKSAIGAQANGTVIGGLVVRAHGEGDDGATLDDMAPDGTTSRDYVIANSTAQNVTLAQNAGCANAGSSGGSVVGGNSTSSSTAAPCAATTSTSASATNTTASTGTKAADSPAPSVLLSVALLAIVAILVRRRL
jgi:hypothetical protein